MLVVLKWWSYWNQFHAGNVVTTNFCRLSSSSLWHNYPFQQDEAVCIFMSYHLNTAHTFAARWIDCGCTLKLSVIHTKGSHVICNPFWKFRGCFEETNGSIRWKLTLFSFLLFIFGILHVIACHNGYESVKELSHVTSSISAPETTKFQNADSGKIVVDA